jgi:hypothetical protein
MSVSRVAAVACAMLPPSVVACVARSIVRFLWRCRYRGIGVEALAYGVEEGGVGVYVCMCICVYVSGA